MARTVFNPPPGWPEPPKGWTPPPGWKPDPEWPEPPPGWNFTKRRGVPRWLVSLAGFLVLVAAGFLFAYVEGKQEVDTAPRAGDCAKVDPANAKRLVKVDCSASDAQLKVTSRHDNTSDIDTACAADSSAEQGYAFEEQSHNVTVASYVICVAAK